MSESQAKRTLAKILRQRGWLVQAVEDRYSAGVPDWYLCGPVGGVWAEAKRLRTLPKRRSTPVRFWSNQSDLRRVTGQANWLENHVRCGGRSALWIRHPKGWTLWTKDFRRLVTGAAQDELLGDECFSTAGELADALEKL